MTRAIGIDLGTTNSCAAVIEGNSPRVIMCRGGSYAIPSILAIDPQGDLLVGEEARAHASQDPDSAVIAPKRALSGTFQTPEAAAIRRLFTHSMVESDEGDVLLAFGGKVFDLVEVSTRILQKIKEIAEDFLDEEVSAAVITVPAYFNAKQRRSIRQAGTAAGLEVLRILNEPTAAALAYGLGRDLRQRIAVFDLGGGTLDLSIIEIQDRVFEVVATGGDPFLGGLDFDDRLIRYVVEHFELETGVALHEDRIAIQRIREAVEQAKIELSTVESTHIEVPYLAKTEQGALGLDMSLSRTELEELTGDLVERSAAQTRALFDKANVSLADIDEVLLVGGQSRMPLVRRTISQLFQKEPCKGVHPDEAVAVGASIMAYSLASTSGPSISLLDALPQPIGIEQADGSFLPIFPKSCPLPHVRRLTLTNSEAEQRTIMLKLFRGANSGLGELLGTFVFSGLEPQPRGQVKLQVWINIDTDGLLSVRATDRSTKLPVDVGLKTGQGLSEPVLSLTTESRRGEVLSARSGDSAPGPVRLEQPLDQQSAVALDEDAPRQDTESTGAMPPTADGSATDVDLGSVADSSLSIDESAEFGAAPSAQEPVEAPSLPSETAEQEQTSEPYDEQEQALLEQLVGETRAMQEAAWEQEAGVESISPAGELGSVWDEGRNRASAAGASLQAAASLEGDEDVSWLELFLPWNWWK